MKKQVVNGITVYSPESIEDYKKLAKMVLNGKAMPGQGERKNISERVKVVRNEVDSSK